MKSLRLILLMVLGVTLISVFLTIQPDRKFENAPSIVRLGVVPDQNSEELRSRYTPLVDYLAKTSNRNVELVIASSYSHLLQLFENREIELANFGGLGFVQAHTFYSAEPLVMREIDTRFTSWFMVQAQNSTASLTGMQGKRFSFGSRLSTSGHVMPRHFMKQEYQIVPERFFSRIDYSGAHDATVYKLVRDETDLIVVNPVIVKAMISDGRLASDTLRLLWETPPYPDYVWTVQSYLDDEFKTQMRNAFLALDPMNLKDKPILDGLSSSGFLPAGSHDFNLLTNIAKQLNLLDPGPQ